MSNKYFIISNIRQFRGHKWIPDEILAHKHVPILRFSTFFDKFTMFNPNVHEADNFAHFP